MIKFFELIFWFSILAIVYTYVLYPFLLSIFSIFIRRPARKADIEPEVSVIIAVHNEESNIAMKIRDTLELDYPKEKLQILVASDCSQDKTDEIVYSLRKEGVILIRQNEHLGRAAAQNKAVKYATGDIVLFTDATTKLRKDTLRKIVVNFADDKVGCVVAALKYINSNKSQLGKAKIDYYAHEKFLYRKESNLNSVLRVNRSCYAVRKEMYMDMDPDLISDFVISWLVVEQGYRAVFEPEAEAYKDVIETEREAMSKGTRVTSMSVEAFIYMIRFFNPFKYGFFSFQLFSHNILRLGVPFFLIALLFSNIFLLNIEFYRLFIFIQFCFYILTVNSLISKQRTAFYSIVYFFVGNFAILRGIFRTAKSIKKFDIWRSLRR